MRTMAILCVALSTAWPAHAEERPRKPSAEDDDTPAFYGEVESQPLATRDRRWWGELSEDGDERPAERLNEGGTTVNLGTMILTSGDALAGLSVQYGWQSGGNVAYEGRLHLGYFPAVDEVLFGVAEITLVWHAIPTGQAGHVYFRAGLGFGSAGVKVGERFEQDLRFQGVVGAGWRARDLPFFADLTGWISFSPLELEDPQSGAISEFTGGSFTLSAGAIF